MIDGCHDLIQAPCVRHRRGLSKWRGIKDSTIAVVADNFINLLNINLIWVRPIGPDTAVLSTH